MVKYVVIQPLPIPQDVKSGLSFTFDESDVYNLVILSTAQINNWYEAEAVLKHMLERVNEIVDMCGTDCVYALVCSGATLPNSIVAAELNRRQVNWVMLQWERNTQSYLMFTPQGELQEAEAPAMITTPFFTRETGDE